MKKTNTKKGFTIIELVIVIAVIGILAAVLIPTFSGVIEKANESAAMQAARNEYEVFLAEHAAEMDGKENLIIVTGDYQFKVVEGQFNATPLATKVAIDNNAIDWTQVTTAEVTSYEAGFYKFLEKNAVTSENFKAGTYYKAGTADNEIGNKDVKIYVA